MPDASSAPRIAVLASGRGSNLQALVDATADGVLNARIAGVFSDRAHAMALRRAREADTPACALDPQTFHSRDAFDAALLAGVAKDAPDLP
ncbi:MAG: phosphoribosylglycinamide formyltransferase, partial [Luteimonas sp.]